MKNLLRLIALTLCLCFANPTEAVAQPFKSAVGVRLGTPWAASYKTFISESSAIEAFVGYRGYSSFSWITINGAYQIHQDIDAVDGLQWYYGGGAGVQLWNSDFFDSGETTFSVSGYLGLQYTFADAPVSVTADWVPTFFLGDGFGSGGFGGGYGNLAVRYVLGRDAKK